MINCSKKRNLFKQFSHLCPGKRKYFVGYASCPHAIYDAFVLFFVVENSIISMFPKRNISSVEIKYFMYLLKALCHFFVSFVSIKSIVFGNNFVTYTFWLATSNAEYEIINKLLRACAFLKNPFLNEKKLQASTLLKLKSRKWK